MTYDDRTASGIAALEGQLELARARADRFEETLKTVLMKVTSMRVCKDCKTSTCSHVTVGRIMDLVAGVLKK